MTKTERALLTLLRAGIWECEPDETTLFPLTIQEWQEVYRMAKEQTVSGPVFQGVCQLPEEWMPHDELMGRWVVNLDHTEAANRKIIRVQEEILGWLHENGLYPIVLKGQGVAQMYPQPLQRTCGDIDLYFKDKLAYDKAFSLLAKKGLKPQYEETGTYNYVWGEVLVEHHQEFLPIFNPFSQKKIRELVRKENPSDIFPTPLLTMLQLNTHILKHLLVHGIGLRQLADMARACHCLHGKFSSQEYSLWCKRIGINRWEKELNGILLSYLGVDSDELPSSNISENLGKTIMQKVLVGGNFGFYGGSRADSHASFWNKKIHTICTLAKGLKLDFTISPQETIWIFRQLRWKTNSSHSS